MKISLPQHSWAGEEPVTISLPEDWDIEVMGMPGDEVTPLTVAEIRAAIQNPIESSSLQQLAAKCHDVVILFDDNTRGTPIQPMAEAVLEELHAAGVKKEQIRFICALGTHGAHTRIDFVNKLGEDIVKHYPVYNHNPYENCVSIGRVSSGQEVFLNAEFMRCDLKIGIGSITPHPFNGWGGGGKIVLPGVGSIESIEQNHRVAVAFLNDNQLNPISASGSIANDGMRSQIEEVVRLSGFQFKIDAVLNSKKEIIHVTAGDPVAQHYAGIRFAETMYGTSYASEKDVVIVNANSKGSEMLIANYLAALAVKKSGGSVVIVNFQPGGQTPHYLLGPFGRDMGGRMWGGIKAPMSHIRKTIIYTAYPDYVSGTWVGSEDTVSFASSWEEVLEQLGHPSSGTKVGVMIDGTIQYFPSVTAQALKR